MAWDVRRTYYYLVCLVTLLMVIIGSVQAVQRGLELALPVPDVYAPSVEDLEFRYQAREGDVPSRSDLRAQAEAERERHRVAEHRRTLRGLLGSLALIGIAAPVYWLHWRRVREDPEGPS